MSDGFTIGAAMQAPTIFQCPHCNETIDSSAASCRFCGAPVDHEAAQIAAILLAKINQACSDASYMRTTAVAIPIFFALRYLPFFSMAGTIGFIGLLFAVPIWAIRWWLRFGKIVSADPDFKKARSTVKFSGIIVTGVLLLFEVVPFCLTVFGVLAHR
jgi:hypothetical protein